jgi:hypothetical protein
MGRFYKVAKGEAARKVVDKLIRAGLLEEVRAGSSLPVWRRDDSEAMALRITKTGLEAIDVEDEPTDSYPAEARELVFSGDLIVFVRNYSDLRRCRQWSFRAGWLDCNWSPGKQLVTPEF